MKTKKNGSQTASRGDAEAQGSTDQCDIKLQYRIAVGELANSQLFLAAAAGEDALAHARATLIALTAKQRARRAELKVQERRVAQLRRHLARHRARHRAA